MICLAWEYSWAMYSIVNVYKKQNIFANSPLFSLHYCFSTNIFAVMYNECHTLLLMYESLGVSVLSVMFSVLVCKVKRK